MKEIREAYEMMRIQRSKITAASYNPRAISDEARKRLKHQLETKGLVMPLVWNKRTGTLISGHQRLALMDSSKKGGDYDINVAAIDVSPKEERELNVALNNQSAMGEFDPELLGKLLEEMKSDGSLSIGEMAFTESDLAAISDIPDDFFEENETSEKMISDIQGMKDRRKKAREGNEEKDDANFYIGIVFSDAKSLDVFMNKLHLPKNERYFLARKFFGAYDAHRGTVDLDTLVPPRATAKKK